jgi:hypothetical protein
MAIDRSYISAIIETDQRTLTQRLVTTNINEGLQHENIKTESRKRSKRLQHMHRA